MEIIGYLIYALSILITLGWCLQIRQKAKYQQSTEKAIELQGFLMTVSLFLIPSLHISSFHLLWMLPSSFVLGLLSITTPLKYLWFFSSFYFSFWYIGIINAGRKFYVNVEYEQAVTAYEKEINKKATAETYFNLALSYGKLGDHKNEIIAYQHSIDLKPNPETYFNLGVAYIDNDEKQEAIKAFKQSINLRPEYLKAQYLICKTYAENGEKENAIKALEIIRKIDSNSADELESIINYM